MSLSRALANLNPEELNQAFYALATNTLSRGGDLKSFDSLIHGVTRAFHRAGWPKERLREFQRTARNEFSKAKAARSPLAAEANEAAVANSN